MSQGIKIPGESESGGVKDWQVNTYYAVGREVTIDGDSDGFEEFYKVPAGQAHVSSVFADDLAAGKWVEVSSPASGPPAAHASSHQDLGSDEIATATPAANAIPKADAAGDLDAWISTATALIKGIASFNASNLPVTAGDVNTAQDILTTSSPTFANLNLSTGGALRTGLVAGNTLLLQAYDVNGTAFTTFATLTANDTPSMDLATGVTIASNYIYRAGGTDIPVTDGGTGLSTFGGVNTLLFTTAADNISSITTANNGCLITSSGGVPSISSTLPSAVVSNIDHNSLSNYDIAQHRIINDSGTLTTELFSASKILSLVAAAVANADKKDAVKTVATKNIKLSGLQTINGYLTVAGDRVGCVSQTAEAENGIYVAAAGAWTRSTDMDSDDEITNGSEFTVGNTSSTKNGFTYICTTPDPITIGVTATSWTEIKRVEFGTAAGTATEGNDARVPTQDENDAFTGSYGGPSALNVYVTETDIGVGVQGYSASLASLAGLTFVSTSFVKMTAAGTFGLDTSTYLTGNQSITLSGDVSGTGTTAITTAIGSDKITEAMLKCVDSAVDEDILTYESTTGDFEWHSATEVKSSMSLNLVENTALSTWIGTANITTLGTITTGVWNAGAGTFAGNILLPDPGTSANSYSITLTADNSGTPQSGSIQVMYGADPYLRISAPNDSGVATAILDLKDTRVVIGAGTAGVDYEIYFNGETNQGILTYMEDEDRLDFDGAMNVAGALTVGGNVAYYATGTDVTVADGGTGRSTATAYGVLCGGTTTTGAHQSVAALGNAGDVLTSGGAGVLPSFQALSS